MDRDASNVALSALPPPFLLDRFRGGPEAAARSRDRENELLFKNEDSIRKPRLRPAPAEVRSGQGMLRPVRLWSRGTRHLRDPIRLSAGRRRNFCRLHFFGAQPLTATSGSAAARLILLDRVGSSRQLPDESGKETQPEDSMKYLLSIVAALALVGTASATSRSADCCGGGACCLVKTSCCAK